MFNFKPPKISTGPGSSLLSPSLFQSLVTDKKKKHRHGGFRCRVFQNFMLPMLTNFHAKNIWIPTFYLFCFPSITGCPVGQSGSTVYFKKIEASTFEVQSHFRNNIPNKLLGFFSDQLQRITISTRFLVTTLLNFQWKR